MQSERNESSEACCVGRVSIWLIPRRTGHLTCPRKGILSNMEVVRRPSWMAILSGTRISSCGYRKMCVCKYTVHIQPADRFNERYIDNRLFWRQQPNLSQHNSL